MAVLKCKMCGGDVVLAPDKTFGTCEYCGCTMTFPKVNDDQRAATFNRGNHFRRIGEFDKALEVYERVLADDDKDAEAHWCCALCRFGIEYVEDPTTYEWMPTCHRASFDSFLEDVDYLAALEHSDGVTRRQYQKDAAKIAEVQRGILATSQNTEPYDVFICYKELDENGKRTRDSILAQEIYYRLKEREWRVFFSRISLEDVPGTQYEPYIFAALNSALVMVVVGTSAENLNSVWVKNEWSRFLALMKKDHSKLLIPCYRDMDPYDLPDQLSVLMSYDIGRIGFIQDLIRGVDKVLSAEKKDSATETVKETVVVQQGSGPNVTALLKRGNIALEDGEWENANSFFDQALNMNAECAEAYVGQGLAEQKCHDTEEYIQRVAHRSVKTERKYISKNDDRIRKARETYPVEGFLKWDDIKGFYEYDLGYNSSVNAQKEAQNKVIADFEKDKYFARAKRFTSEGAKEPYNELRKKLIARLTRNVEEALIEEKREITGLESRYDEFLNLADQKSEIAHKAAVQKREEYYLDICHSHEKARSISEYQALISKFQNIETYKDSLKRIEECKKSISDLEELEKCRIAEEKKISAEIALEEDKQEKIIKEEEVLDGADEETRKAEESGSQSLAPKSTAGSVLFGNKWGIATAVFLVLYAIMLFSRLESEASALGFYSPFILRNGPKFPLVSDILIWLYMGFVILLAVGIGLNYQKLFKLSTIILLALTILIPLSYMLNTVLYTYFNQQISSKNSFAWSAILITDLLIIVQAFLLYRTTCISFSDARKYCYVIMGLLFSSCLLRVLTDPANTVSYAVSAGFLMAALFCLSFYYKNNKEINELLQEDMKSVD